MGEREEEDRDWREKRQKERNRDWKKRTRERYECEKEERETGMGERKDRKRDRNGRKIETGAGEKEIGRETGVGERETGEKEKKLQTQKNSWNFILWYFTPQNGVKHDKCRAIIHCRASIRLPETRLPVPLRTVSSNFYDIYLQSASTPSHT